MPVSIVCRNRLERVLNYLVFFEGFVPRVNESRVIPYLLMTEILLFRRHDE